MRHFLFLFLDDVFTMRQGLASDLKIQIDRAEKMSEEELAALRLEIKVKNMFVCSVFLFMQFLGEYRYFPQAKSLYFPLKYYFFFKFSPLS